MSLRAYVVLVAFAALAALSGWQALRIANLNTQIANTKLFYQTNFRAMAERRTKAIQEARAREQGWADYAAAVNKERNDENAASGARYSHLLEQLRSRPRRPVTSGPTGLPATATDGQIGTGAGLYREDGEFLAGEAARANVLRGALAACYKQYDRVREGLQKPQ